MHCETMDEPTNLYTIPVTVSVTASYFEMLYYLMFKAILLWLVLMTHCRQTSWGGRNALKRHSIRSITLRRMVFESDLACVENTRMNRRAFYSLCDLLSSVGRLRCDGSISVEEAVAIFLHILAHDEKNRVIKRQFVRSGESISRQFRNVLNAVMRCHNILLKKPTPIPEDSTDERWKWFKNCLGALDGTYIQVNVYDIDKARYRTRKKEVATNVLGVCSPDMQFIYILPGWEGSAADSRVLRDAIARRNGLQVPHGYYYLCDAGYPNGEGFLTPYRSQRYHLSDWSDGRLPRTARDFYMDGQSTRQNNNNTKHKWDRQEDEHLIECLTQLAQSGNWRADNGTFQSGFLQQLERWMHDKIPNCQIKATPHISSRVKLWKKQYYALSEMLGPNASGFGWNDNEKCIICEKDVYDDWVKSHPTTTGLRGKSLPFLEQWSIVFGKDRANGLGAKSLADAVEDIEREEATNEDRGRNVEVNMNNNLDNEELDDNPVDEDHSNILPTQRTDSSVFRRTRKRRISSTDMLNESIGKSICSMENMFGTASDNIAKLAGCFQFMANDAAKKDGVSAEIDKIQGLSLLDRIKAGFIISRDTSKTNYYFSLADDKKSEYVSWVLGGYQM